VVVFDASVLIALARILRLDLVERTYGGGVIGPVVFDEVVTAGKRIGAPGVEQVEHAIETGWLRAVRTTAAERRLAAQILKTSRLHRGEAEALALAKRRGLLVAIDDREARSMARALGLDLVGSAGLLLEAFYRGRLGLEELEDTLLALSRVIWLSPEVVATVLKLAREEEQ
jgi:predicted nucleic acid-binding protein